MTRTAQHPDHHVPFVRVALATLFPFCICHRIQRANPEFHNAPHSKEVNSIATTKLLFSCVEIYRSQRALGIIDNNDIPVDSFINLALNQFARDTDLVALIESLKVTGVTTIPVKEIATLHLHEQDYAEGTRFEEDDYIRVDSSLIENVSERKGGLFELIVLAVANHLENLNNTPADSVSVFNYIAEGNYFIHPLTVDRILSERSNESYIIV